MTAERINIIFQSLGYFSPSYGLIDYLRGHGPLLCPTDDVILYYQVPKSASEPDFDYEELKINISLNEDHDSVDTHMSSILSSIATKNLSSNHILGIRYAITVSHSLQWNVQSRLSLLVLRLRLLYVLIHCQSGDKSSSSLTLEQYLVASESCSKILKDLIALADISSSVWVELDLALFPYPLASLALDCLMGIFEFNQSNANRRLSKSSVHSLMLRELGISPSNDRNGGESRNDSSDLHWLSILLSACSLMTEYSIKFPFDTGKMLSREEIMGSMSHFPNSEGRIPKAYIAEYAHMAIELFSGCLAIRDYRINSEAAGLSALITLISNQIETVNELLTYLDNEDIKCEWPELVYDLFPILKALQCLEMSITSHSSRTSVLRENDWLTALSQLLDVFSKSKSPLLWKPNTVLNDILLSCLNLLGVLISGGRRRMVVATESGIQLLYHPHVSTLIHLALDTKDDRDPYFSIPLLQTLCELFYSAIEVEPTYLAHFLRTGVAERLIEVMITPITLPNSQILSSPISPHPLSYLPNVQKPEGILIDFLRLLQSMCITSEGRALVLKKQGFQYVVQSVVHSVNLFPISEGISMETLGFIGSEMSQVLRDHEGAFRAPILEALKTNFIRACERMNLPNFDHESTVQEILNLAIILESLLAPGRDGVSAEVSKEFFRGDIIKTILESHTMTLPSSRQLFAEITTHYQSTARKYYGNYYLSQSLTNLLKIGISLSPQDALPVLFGALDNCLVEIGVERDALLNPRACEESKDEGKAKSRSDNPPNVMFLGVLARFPDECIFTKEYEIISRDLQIETLGNLVRSLITLDWMTSITAVCLHPNRHSRSQAIDARLMMSGKDVLRRLFAFYRSSLLELCRVISEKWEEKPYRELVREYSQDPDYSIFPPQSESRNSKSQFPSRYLLKICISSGAIARERSEIDGSRVLLTLTRESELIAYERVQIHGGIIRYRTSHGWISEFQRDTKRHPIVTVLDILGPNEENSEKNYYMALPHNDHGSQELQKTLQSCTLRDGVCHLLCRIHSSLKIAAGYLSQTVVADIDSRHSERLFSSSSIKFTEFGHVIALSMAKITSKFFENPIQDLSFWPKDSLSRTPSEEKLLVDEDATKKANWKKVQEGHGENSGGPNLSFPAVALYLGAVVNFIVATISDERRKNPNTYLLKRYIKHGVIHSVLNSFHFLVDSFISNVSLSDTSATSSLRCAHHSIPPFLFLLSKIVQYDSLNRAPMTTVMRSRGYDTNDSDVTQIIQKLQLKIGRALFPLFQHHKFSLFPAYIQASWIKIIEDLLESLKTISENSRRSNDSHVKESLSGRLARMRSALHAASGERLVDREETTRRNFVNFFSSGQAEDSRLMEAATDLGFTPLQIIDAINAVDSEDMSVVLEHLLRSNLNPDQATSEPETNPFNQFTYGAMDQSSDFATGSGDSAHSTLSHSQPDTMSVTQASVVSGLNTLTVTSEGGSALVSDPQSSSSSDNESSTPHHPPPPPEDHDHEDSLDSDSDSPEPILTEEIPLPAEDEDDEMLRLALAMSMNSGHENSAARLLESNVHISPLREVLTPPSSQPESPSRASGRRSHRAVKEEITVNPLHEEVKLLLKEYESAILLWMREMWRNLYLVSKWSEDSINQLATRLYDFAIRLSPHFNEISIRNLLDAAHQDIQELIAQKSFDNAEFLGFLSFLHVIYCSNDPRSRILSSFAPEKGSKLIKSLCLLINQCSASSSWVSIAFLLANEVIRSIPTKLSSDILEESKEDILSTSGAISSNLSLSVYNSVEKFINGVHSPISAEILQSLMLLLCALLTCEDIALKFQRSGTFQKFLGVHVVPPHPTSSSLQPLISLMIRRCFETSAVLAFSMKLEMKTVFKNLEQIQMSKRRVSAESKVSLDEFLSKTSHLLIRNDKLYASLLQSVVTTYRLSDSDSSPTYVRLSDSSDEQLQLTLGTQTLSTVTLVMDAIINTLSHPQDSLFFLPSICIHALADCALVFKFLALPLVKKVKEGESFVATLIERTFHEELPAPSHLLNIQAVTRLATVLCSYRGPSRRGVLDIILRALKETEFVEVQFPYIGRIGKLIPLICTSCKFTRESHLPSNKTQHMSVDTLSYLLNSDLCAILSHLLVSCDPRSKFAGEIFETLLEAFEIFTRPNVLNLIHHDKQTQLPENVETLVESTEDPAAPRRNSQTDLIRNDVEIEEDEEAEEEEEDEIDEEENEDQQVDEDYEEGEAGRDDIHIYDSGFSRPSSRFAEMLEMFQGQSPDLVFFDGNQNFRTPPQDIRAPPFEIGVSDSLGEDHLARNAFYHFIRSVAPESMPRDPRSEAEGQNLPHENLLPGGIENALRLNWDITSSARNARDPDSNLPDPIGLLSYRNPQDTLRTPDRRIRRHDDSALGREMERFFRLDFTPGDAEEARGWLLGRPSEGSGEIIENLRRTLQTQAVVVELPEETSRFPESHSTEMNEENGSANIQSTSDSVLPTTQDEESSLLDHVLVDNIEPIIQSEEMPGDAPSHVLHVDSSNDSSNVLGQDNEQNPVSPDAIRVEMATTLTEEAPDSQHVEQEGNEDVAEEQQVVNQENTHGLICPPGYDVEVFNSLPEFMQREIIESHQETSGDQMNTLLEAAGYDLETLNALPENIRQEIIDQVRREHNPQPEIPAVSQVQEIDNNTFLSSLTEDLRNEVLLTADGEFLASLNPEYQAQANLIRERHARRWTQMEAAQTYSAQTERRRGDRSQEPAIPPPEPEVPIHPGYMRIKIEEVSHLRLPDAFLRFFFNLLFVDVLPVSLKTLHRIAQNLCKDTTTREFFLQIIVALLGEAPHGSPIFARLRNDSLNSFPPVKIILTSHPGVSLLQNTDDKVEFDLRPPLPSLVGRRLLSLLLHLNGHVDSVSFEMLQFRSFSDMRYLTLDAEELCAEDSTSHHNYIEVLLRLLRYPQLTENSHDMLHLTKLVNQLCEPLEILNEQTSESESESKGESFVADGYRWIRVPAVPLSKFSLKSLCDALMSEYCTKEVFDHIISTISRLACVNENCSVLMDVLVEVILDLAVLSNSKIQNVISHFVDVSISPPRTRKANSIPLGEIGSQDHLRLFRALQMLETLSSKVGKSLTEILPSEEFNCIWQSTDHFLRLLESHFIPADSVDKFDQKKQLNSTLSSVLSKILPLIEGFFLVHTIDYLKASSESVPPDREKANNIQQSPSSHGSLPGAKYRTTEAFKKVNISLLTENDRDLQHATSLSRLKSFQRSRSLRSNPSFDSSSIFSTTFQGPHRLLAFVHCHKNILNLLIKWYPTLLDGSLQALIRIVQLRTYLSFDSKRIYFYSQLKQRKNSSSTHHRSIHLQVHRDSIFEESFNQLRFRSPDEMKGRLVVSFAEEEGIDAGGLTREWFGILTREIFNPNYCLFTAAADGATFQPNPYSGINTNHLDYFKFVGKVFGKAVVDGYLLDGHFTRSFYKHVLGIPVEYSDIEGLEPEYYKSLKQILEFPLEDLGLELTFSAESHTFGKHQVWLTSAI